MPKRKILVATTNPGKVAELRILLGTTVQWLGLPDVPPLPEVQEDGETFAQNARKKATAYARASGQWTLSDDSGLVVDALGGAPGVRSARYAGIENADRVVVDRANMDKLLAELRGVPPDERGARFVCCLCLASPTEVLVETRGTLEGFILTQKRGRHGFGYDPIFLVASHEKSMAELTPDEKNGISHRGKALRSLWPHLEQRLASHLEV